MIGFLLDQAHFAGLFEYAVAFVAGIARNKRNSIHLCKRRRRECADNSQALKGSRAVGAFFV
jgi:hypothetical protein